MIFEHVTLERRPVFAPIRHQCSHLPRWALALAFVLPLMVLDDWMRLERVGDLRFNPHVRAAVFAAAIALPGAFLAGRVVHAATMVAGCSLVIAFQWCIWWYYIDLRQFLPSQIMYSGVRTVYPLSVLVTIGIVEWYFSRQRSPRLFLWVVIVCIGGAAVASVVGQMRFALYPESHWDTSRTADRVDMYVPWLIEGVIVWLCIAVAERLAERGQRLQKALVVSLVCMAVVMAQWYLNVFVYDLAKRSLTGLGPFPIYHGAELLEVRGRASDHEAILRQLATFEPGPNADFGWAIIARRISAQHYGEEFRERLLEAREDLGLDTEDVWPFR